EVVFVIITRPVAFAWAAVPEDGVVLVRMKMGRFTAYASLLALSARKEVAGSCYLDAARVFSEAAKVDFTGYYLCGPGNSACEEQAASSVSYVTWDIKREQFLPPAAGDWQPW